MVTTTERTKRPRRAIATGTAGRGMEDVIWVNPTHISGIQARRPAVERYLTFEDGGLFTWQGHGTGTTLEGQEYEAIFSLNGPTVPLSLIRGKVVQLLSCEAGRELGLEMVAQGCIAFFGLSQEPQRETPVLDVVGPNPSVGTLVSQEPNPRVQYFRFGETAATYTPAISSESTAQPAYHVSTNFMAGRVVENRAQEVITQKGLENLIQQMAELVDSNLELTVFRGGSFVYQESIENPDDWEVVVVTKLGISRKERFDLSLRIGEALNRAIAAGPQDHNWNHLAFSLELA